MLNVVSCDIMYIDIFLAVCTRIYCSHAVKWVTEQLTDMLIRGLPARGLVNSQTSQLADWTSHGLDNSWSRRCHWQ